MTKKRFLSFFVALVLACAAMVTLASCGAKITALELDTSAVKVDYISGQELDLTGLKVTAVNEDDSKTELTAEEYTVSPAAGTKLTENTTVTVALKSDEAIKTTFKVKVHNNVTAVAIKTAPTKTEYWSGEAFDATGFVLEATLEDGSKEDVTVKDNAKVTADKTTLTTTKDSEKQTITFTYAGKTVEQEVNVKADPIVDLKLVASPRLEYMQGETFDPAGIKFNAVYKSGKEAALGANVLTSATYRTEPFTEAEGSTVKVTLTWQGLEYDFDVTIAKGVAIEAEDGTIVSTSVVYQTDAVQDDTKQGVWDDKYLASGGVYLAELNAGDTVTFEFSSDKAGKANIAFRMSSKYLKADSSWVPIWMADCQFNKIAKFYVNGEEYSIDDTVILPGGGSADGEPNFYLWFNWVEVAFNNIDLKEGANTITLEYVAHDYNDCSQSSFNGTFSSNVDCLKVVSSQCNIEVTNATPEPSEAPEAPEANNVGVRPTKSGNTIDFFNVADWTSYDAVNAEAKPELQEDGSLKFTAATASFIDNFFYEAVSVDADGNVIIDNPVHKNVAYDDLYGKDFVYTMNLKADGNFTLYVFATSKTDMLTNPAAYRAIRIEYVDGVISIATSGDGAGAVQASSVKTDYTFAEGARLDIVAQRIDVDNAKITLFVDGAAVALTGTPTYGSIADGYSYVFAKNGYGQRFAFSPLGETTLYVSAVKSLDFAGKSASIKAEDGKALLVLNGTYTASGYTEDAIKTEIAAHYFDLQENPYAVSGTWSGNWTAHQPEAMEVALNEDGTYTATYDITDLAVYKYTMHYGWDPTANNGQGQGADVKPAEAYDETVTVGSKSYQMVVVPGSSDGAQFWGCVGVIVTEVAAA